MSANMLGENSEAPVPQGVKFQQLRPSRRCLGLSNAIYHEFIRKINNAIANYHIASSVDARKAALKKMQEAIQYVDLHATPHCLAFAGEFHEVKKDLFVKIKTAYAENGVHTMFQAGNADSPLARIIADIPPDKADTLMQILILGNKDLSKENLEDNLKSLFDSRDHSPEAMKWRDFLRKHSIEFLGGNNSKNYKVTNKDASDPINFGLVNVLKIDNRLGMPRFIEQYLRETLGDIFTPIDAHRQVRGLSDGKWVSRTLLVTDFCTLGSVDDHSVKIRANGTDETYRGAANIMGQMAKVLLDIQKANCCFPDAKLTNWLVDESGSIRLADTKSFVFTQKGFYDETIHGNEDVSILTTPGFRPREIEYQHGRFNAEKLHASLLGRNIYTYLTGSWPNRMGFNRPIFEGTVGQQYKQLIMDLTRDPSEQRISIEEAQAKLLELQTKLQDKVASAVARTSDAIVGEDIIPEQLRIMSEKKICPRGALVNYTPILDPEKWHTAIASLSKVIKAYTSKRNYNNKGPIRHAQINRLKGILQRLTELNEPPINHEKRVHALTNALETFARIDKEIQLEERARGFHWKKSDLPKGILKTKNIFLDLFQLKNTAIDINPLDAEREIFDYECMCLDACASYPDLHDLKAAWWSEEALNKIKQIHPSYYTKATVDFLNTIDPEKLDEDMIRAMQRDAMNIPEPMDLQVLKARGQILKKLDVEHLDQVLSGLKAEWLEDIHFELVKAIRSENYTQDTVNFLNQISPTDCDQAVLLTLKTDILPRDKPIILQELRNRGQFLQYLQDSESLSKQAINDLTKLDNSWWSPTNRLELLNLPTKILESPSVRGLLQSVSYDEDVLTGLKNRALSNTLDAKPLTIELLRQEGINYRQPSAPEPQLSDGENIDGVPLTQAVTSLESALNHVLQGNTTGDVNKQKIAQHLLNKLGEIKQKPYSADKVKDVITILYQAERAMSHHRHWWWRGGRSSTRETSAFKATKVDFESARTNLRQVSNEEILAQSDIIHDTEKTKEYRKPKSGTQFAFTYVQQKNHITDQDKARQKQFKKAVQDHNATKGDARNDQSDKFRMK